MTLGGQARLGAPVAGDGLWNPGRVVRRTDTETQSLANILNLVRTGATSTRQAIEAETGLGRAIVAERVATLIGHKLLEEGELGSTAGGRPPRTIRFSDGTGVILLATIGQSTISIGIAELSGRLLAEHHEPLDPAPSADQLVKRLGTLFDWVLEQHKGGRSVWGIGIALSGPVDAKDGQPFRSPIFNVLPSLSGYPFVERLAVRYQAPVWVRNKVHMTTLGELRAGSSESASASDLLFVELGAEINAGLISGGRLHRGFQGSAGMIGHIQVDKGQQTVCRCGNAGCLETVAGGDAIARAGLEAAKSGRSRILADLLAQNGELTAADVGSASHLGDPASSEILSRCGRLIGTVVAALATAINPTVIVLGGVVAQTSDIPLATIRETIYRCAHPLVTRDLRILRSQMSSSAGLVGLAFGVVEELFAAETLVAWIGCGSPLQHPDTKVQLQNAEAVLERADQIQPAPPAQSNRGTK